MLNTTSRFDLVMNVMGSALSAESTRMSITASNLANANSMGSSEENTYHSKHPVFQEVQQQVAGLPSGDQPIGGVRVVDIMKSQKPLQWHYDPDNPLADDEGHVYKTDVDPIAEMTDMIESSKNYNADVEVMNTTKNLLLKTIRAMNI